MFIDQLVDKIKQYDNPTVAGLDPRIEYIPLHIREKACKEWGMTPEGAAQAIKEFNKRIIDALHDIVPAVKPQLAYYEMYGIEGIKAFEETVQYAHSKGMLVIADGKRNDIGSTAEAYAAAYLGQTQLEGDTRQSMFATDALTVNGYLGQDGIQPFIKECKAYGKGIFVLVKTSNPSSSEFQDLKTEGGRLLYERVAEKVDLWGKECIGRYGYSSVGAVVGATYPAQAAALRSMMKQAYILVPGYGAQGGTARDAAVNFNADGLGAIVNASRSMMCAYKSAKWSEKYSEECFEEACRAEALDMRLALKEAIEERKK